MTAPETAAHRLPVRLLRFACVGVVGLVVDAGTLRLLITLLPIDPLLARGPSYLAAATVAWALHRRFTFGDRTHSGSPVAQWLAFLAANSIGAGLNYIVFAALVTFWSLAAAVPELAVAIASLIAMAVNFIASSRLVFQQRRS